MTPRQRAAHEREVERLAIQFSRIIYDKARLVPDIDIARIVIRRQRRAVAAAIKNHPRELAKQGWTLTRTYRFGKKGTAATSTHTVPVIPEPNESEIRKAGL